MDVVVAIGFSPKSESLRLHLFYFIFPLTFKCAFGVVIFSGKNHENKIFFLNFKLRPLYTLKSA